jgi:hypothetical protein
VRTKYLTTSELIERAERHERRLRWLAVFILVSIIAGIVAIVIDLRR